MAGTLVLALCACEPAPALPDGVYTLSVRGAAGTCFAPSLDGQLLTVSGGKVAVVVLPYVVVDGEALGEPGLGFSGTVKRLGSTFAMKTDRVFPTGDAYPLWNISVLGAVGTGERIAGSYKFSGRFGTTADASGFTCDFAFTSQASKPRCSTRYLQADAGEGEPAPAFDTFDCIGSWASLDSHDPKTGDKLPTTLWRWYAYPGTAGWILVSGDPHGVFCKWTVVPAAFRPLACAAP